MKIIVTEEEILVLQAIKEHSIYVAEPALMPAITVRMMKHGYVRPDSQGQLILTELGTQALFKKQCFTKLLAFSKNPQMSIQMDIGEWLNMAGFVKPKIIRGQVFPGDFEMTPKGWDWIAFVDSSDV